eukprot:TRINITY_DN14818_c0_g1_i1.p1 TRINITY_DN14818_c0_g1~~TRINITY_DN14818_c0_g1_i1.p1  ORF type:complete len:122 (+),score=2.89 TRINITY_DN14818_c0_g1_i1:1035-1400(+)
MGRKLRNKEKVHSTISVLGDDKFPFKWVTKKVKKQGESVLQNINIGRQYRCPTNLNFPSNGRRQQNYTDYLAIKLSADIIAHLQYSATISSLTFNIQRRYRHSLKKGTKSNFLGGKTGFVP